MAWELNGNAIGAIPAPGAFLGTTNLIGTQVMSDFRARGDGVYKGRAFDPKRNLRAPATIRLIGDSTLVVKGCLIGGLICKEQRWKKVG